VSWNRLDFFIVNVALPSMQESLRMSAGAVEWVVAGYGLTFAVFLVTAGRLGDQLGRRRVFSLGLGAVRAHLGGVRCGPESDAHQRWLQRPGGAPLLDVALFRIRTLTVGLLCQLTFFSGMVSFVLVLALYLQRARGLSALGAGMVFTILAAATSLPPCAPRDSPSGTAAASSRPAP
jgi:MFS family permease